MKIKLTKHRMACFYSLEEVGKEESIGIEMLPEKVEEINDIYWQFWLVQIDLRKLKIKEQRGMR